jgi:hypothetical protein
MGAWDQARVSPRGAIGHGQAKKQVIASAEKIDPPSVRPGVASRSRLSPGLGPMGFAHLCPPSSIARRCILSCGNRVGRRPKPV